MISVAASFLIATVGMAQTPAGAPAGSTGMCRDGSYWSGATKQGACRGHKGVQDWYATGAASSSGNAANSAPAHPATAATANEAGSAKAGSAPAGSTGLCRDGSYWSGAVKKGACRGHKGVQDWYATDGAATSGMNTTAAHSTPATGTSSAAPASKAAPEASAPKEANAPAATAAPGGGADKVWVNSSSKVYHCPSDRWYGKTKNGAYMSEADAIAQGNRADHHKACK
ncbi:MAG: hypothetical protein NVS9B2_07920 [Steroidobacteraceae bacterium]